MKGLNVKRIAAIGLGAALVGSVLAPAVMAAAYSNLTTLKKENVVDSTGTPVVDIVVGSMGQAPDVVWAGNIAAKVAQLATTDVAGSGTKTVDYTVGGTTSTSGAGDTVESAVDYSVQEAAFNGIQVTDSKMPGLVNDTSYDMTWAGTDSTLSVKEVLKATSNVDFQSSTSSSAYASGELFASIAAGDLNYSVELGTGLIALSANAYKNLDGNADYDVTIPWLGKTYIVDETTADSIIMYSDTTPTDLEVGQKITVTPGTAYAGKTMEIQLVDLIQIGSGNTTYEPKWGLLIDGVATKYVQKAATDTYDLRTQFGKTYFTDSIYVTAAGLNLAANKYTATVRTGAERLELKDGKGYPFTDDSDVDNYAPWKVVLTGNPVTKITLQNQYAYTKTSGSESSNSNTKYVKLAGEEVVLPSDFAAFKFVGLQTKPTAEVQIGDVSGIEGGGIKYMDLRGNTIEVPLYVQFDVDANVPKEVTISGKDYTFWMGTGTGSNDSKVYYKEGKHSSSVDYTGWDSIDANSNAIVAASTIPLDLGAETATGTTVNTNYIWVQDSNTGTGNTAGLILQAQTFNISNNADSATAPVLKFIGTTYGVGEHVAAYVPNTEDFMNTILNSTKGAWVSTKNFSSDFNYTDNANDVATLFLKTGDTAKVWEYKSIKGTDNNNLGPSLDANTIDWSIGTDVTDPLSAALTEDGTLVESDGSVFTLTVPDQNRNAEVYLGGTATSTVTTGGTKYTGVATGETKGNVTIDAVTGATSGKNIVKVGNIVKLDTDSSYGKSIIVGGFMVNKVAVNLSVDSKTLEERLVAAGDYVAAVLADGKIVVAGYTADDTATAAKALIAVLDGF